MLRHCLKFTKLIFNQIQFYIAIFLDNMPNAFSRYCFRQKPLEEALSHFTIKRNFNGCDALFGEPDCVKLLDWTDGENAENIQVFLLTRCFLFLNIISFYKLTNSVISVWFVLANDIHCSSWYIGQPLLMMALQKNTTLRLESSY